MTENSEKLGIAVIGCGQWGPNHIRNFAAQKRAHVVWCADLNAQRLEAVRDSFPTLSTSTDVNQAMADPRVNAVVIATPTSTHFSLAQRALGLGKHVLVEKPLAASATEAEALMALARSTGRVLMVGHVFLFNPGITKLRQLLTAGDLGRVYYVHATRTNLGPIRQDVDCVWDLAPHDVSIINYLLDSQPLEVTARGSHYLQDQKVDIAFITLTYPNGVLANVHISWLDPKKTRQLTVVGDRKMVTWDDMTPASPVTIYDKGVVREPFYKDFGEFQLVTKEGDVIIPKIHAEEPLRLQTDYFMACVEKGHADLCGPQQGLAVVRVLEAVGESMKAGGAPVRIRA